MTSFQMNDRCAAGCGRYLGYIADEMNLGVHELGPLACQSSAPVRINSTCTVFAGAELRERLSLGEKREDILAGLHRAIILRAMSLIARSGGVTDQFTFTGGVAKNPAAVDALAAPARRKLRRDRHQHLRRFDLHRRLGRGAVRAPRRHAPTRSVQDVRGASDRRRPHTASIDADGGRRRRIRRHQDRRRRDRRRRATSASSRAARSASAAATRCGVTQACSTIVLHEAGVRAGRLGYVATTGEGEIVPFRTGHFYGMTTHARGGLFLEPEARAIIDMGALHTRAVAMDERSKVLGYRMTSQCASGSGQFLENIARYLGVSLEEVGALSLQADQPEACSSICAVLAETDVINMVSRGISAAEHPQGHPRVHGGPRRASWSSRSA